jgi:hypothetical protein
MPLNPTCDVCSGGTASSGSTSVTFRNDNPSSCTISGLGSLVDCPDPFTVPGRSGGTAGTKTCNIKSGATTGTYTYTVGGGVNCPGQTNPSVVYQ